MCELVYIIEFILRVEETRKMQGLPRILSLFRNELDELIFFLKKVNNTGFYLCAQMSLTFGRHTFQIVLMTSCLKM